MSYQQSANLRTRAHYETQWSWLGDFSKVKIDDRRKAILTLLGTPEADLYERRVLVAGSAYGWEVYVFASMGADVTGIDLYTKKAEEFLRKMNDPPTTARCRLVEHDLEIPIAEFIQNKFDLIYCNGIIHHTRNPPAICRNLRSYLADNGRLLLGVYGVGGLFWHKVSVLRALARLLTSLGWTTTDVAGLFQRRNLVPIWNKRFKSEQGIESVVWTLENLLVPILRQYRPDEIEAVMRDSGLRPLTRYDSAQQKHFPLASYPRQGLWRRIRKGHGPLLYIAEGI